jgi:hypothetical protein
VVYFVDEQAQCLVNVPTNDFDSFVEIKGKPSRASSIRVDHI